MTDRMGTIVVEVHIPDGEDYERALNQAAGAVEYGIQGTGFTYCIATEATALREQQQAERALDLSRQILNPHGWIGGGGSPIEDY